VFSPNRWTCSFYKIIKYFLQQNSIEKKLIVIINIIISKIPKNSPLKDDDVCEENDPLAIPFTASQPAQIGRLYTINSNRATIVFWPNLYGQFKLQWEEVGPNETAGGEGGEGSERGGEGGKGIFSACGGELEPNYYATQTLNSPKDPNNMIW
jgi:hypothetical protein